MPTPTEHHARDTLPSATLDLGDFPPDLRLNVWRDLTESLFDTVPVTPSRPYHAQVGGYQAGDLLFQHVQFDATVFHREPRQTRLGEGDFLVLEMPLTGSQQVTMDHGVFRFQPGHIYLRDWARSFHAVTSAMTLHSLVIPRHRLRASHWLYQHCPVASWSLDTPTGRLLAGNWMMIQQELPRLCMHQASELATGFIGLLDALLAPDPGARNPVNLEAMQSYTLAHLQEPDFNLDDLGKAFSVSRATVYRLFQPLGGFQRYLRMQRLKHCYGELCTSAPVAGSVAQVARRWGFYEPSSFNRSFREIFGLPPSAVLGSRYVCDAQPGYAAPMNSPIHLETYQGFLRGLREPQTGRWPHEQPPATHKAPG